MFVDEFTCIGCRNCANVCPSTFMMEEEWGRARVAQQGVDGVERLQVGLGVGQGLSMWRHLRGAVRAHGSVEASKRCGAGAQADGDVRAAFLAKRRLKKPGLSSSPHRSGLSEHAFTPPQLLLRPPPCVPPQEAIDTCPVSCIHWVTAPQLALLEETMSRMERVAAWLLVSAASWRRQALAHAMARPLLNGFSASLQMA